MDLLSHDELKKSAGFNFAPMVDFLFLMLALFAFLAISRTTPLDTDIRLAELKSEGIRAKGDLQQINLSISKTGGYKWLTEFEDYPMQSIKEIQQEISRQYQIGALPQDKTRTEVLLHIDENAPWKPIAEAIFAIRELGFNAHPVYEPLQ